MRDLHNGGNCGLTKPPLTLTFGPSGRSVRVVQAAQGLG